MMLDWTHSFPNEVSSRVVQEGLKNGHQRIFVLSKETQGDLAGSPEWPFVMNS